MAYNVLFYHPFYIKKKPQKTNKQTTMQVYIQIKKMINDEPLNNYLPDKVCLGSSYSFQQSAKKIINLISIKQLVSLHKLHPAEEKNGDRLTKR